MKAEVKMDGNFLHVFGVGKLGHEPFVTLSRLFHGLFYLFFLRFVRVGMDVSWVPSQRPFVLT